MKTIQTKSTMRGLDWELNNKFHQKGFSDEGKEYFEKLFSNAPVKIGNLLKEGLEAILYKKDSDEMNLLGIVFAAIFLYLVIFSTGTPNPKAQISSASFVSVQHSNNENKPVKKPTKKNIYAPVSHKSLNSNSIDRYIERFDDVAISEMDRFGIPASISMAQAIIESQAGNSTLSIENNNHFGIKCFERNCKKGHCTNHTDDNHKDFFRKYDTAWESWRSHSLILKSDRYQDLFEYGEDYKKWAVGLQNDGYATDKNYSKKLISVIEKYELYKLDEQPEYLASK